LPFPRQDEQGVCQLLWHLRDLFGKERVLEEDGLRLANLRRSPPHFPDGDGNRQEAFLAQLEARVTVSFTKDPLDPRALELINKTNQFNLNGRRYADGEWLAYLRRPETTLLVATYEDKFGVLGKVAVLTGRLTGSKMHVESWVLSCRGFSRRIEHRCLDVLFRALPVQELVFQFQATDRNGPLQEFFAQLMGEPPCPGLRLGRERFFGRCPPLCQRLEGLPHG
jgi:FkbH-like protein